MYVFDSTSLVALFHAHQPVWDLWTRADRGEATLAVPVSAIVEASEQAGIDESSWDAVLWSVGLAVLPLGEIAAKQVGTWDGSLAARQAIWESRATGWPVLTCDPKQYEPGEHVYPV